jgi:hypothetical protein
MAGAAASALGAKSQALSHLAVLFSEADPAYLEAAVEHHLNLSSDCRPSSPSSHKGKRREVTHDAAYLVARVSEKMLELNHGEYPRVAKVKRGAFEKREKEGKLAGMKEIRASWTAATKREEPVAGSSKGVPGGMEVDSYLTKNQALYVPHWIVQWDGPDCSMQDSTPCDVLYDPHRGTAYHHLVLQLLVPLSVRHPHPLDRLHTVPTSFKPQILPPCLLPQS